MFRVFEPLSKKTGTTPKNYILNMNLDAGQPEVVQRGSPWYEKKSFSSLGQNF